LLLARLHFLVADGLKMDLEIPAELTSLPMALVALQGLREDDERHKDLWRRFQAQPEGTGAPLRTIRLEAGQQVPWPPMKPKRNSYEWFIPKGILKRNWVSKHLNRLPAVVAVFADLDWDDQHFNEKKAEAAERVRGVRESLNGRGSKIAVVLLQRSLSLPSADDAAASERASSLCAACELSNRSLFVLPLVTEEAVDGYVTRLRAAFYELAQNYYHQEIRSVKSHKDFLNKTTHLYLFVRRQFKIGFLNELKRDLHAAYKHYSQAYSMLMEVRATDTNIMEVKTVAGFISYKICNLAFRINLPRDAITQFRKHMDIFQQKVGMDGECERVSTYKICRRLADFLASVVAGGLLLFFGLSLSLAEGHPDGHEAQLAGQIVDLLLDCRHGRFVALAGGVVNHHLGQQVVLLLQLLVEQPLLLSQPLQGGSLGHGKLLFALLIDLLPVGLVRFGASDRRRNARTERRAVLTEIGHGKLGLGIRHFGDVVLLGVPTILTGALVLASQKLVSWRRRILVLSVIGLISVLSCSLGRALAVRLLLLVDRGRQVHDLNVGLALSGLPFDQR